MRYKEKVNLFSQAIFSFDKDLPNEMSSLIDENSLTNFRVYRKNIFFGAYNNLSSDFTVLKKHLEEENFRFLVRKYLLEEKIKSSNIYDFSKNFVLFLERTFDFHQDQLLVPLAQLDLLYSHGEWKEQRSCSLPKGLFDYWHQLISGHTEIEFDINLNELEEIKVLETTEARYLKK